MHTLKSLPFQPKTKTLSLYIGFIACQFLHTIHHFINNINQNKKDKMKQSTLSFLVLSLLVTLFVSCTNAQSGGTKATLTMNNFEMVGRAVVGHLSVTESITQTIRQQQLCLRGGTLMDKDAASILIYTTMIEVYKLRWQMSANVQILLTLLLPFGRPFACLRANGVKLQ